MNKIGIITLKYTHKMDFKSGDILFFYSKSKDLPAGSPCKGRLHQEYVSRPEDYSDLSSISNWRKILSNFYAFDFTIEVSPDLILTFRTIEHGFHYFKIRLADPDRAFDFALESGSDLSKGDGLAARRARKLVLLNPQQLQKWDSIKYSVLYFLSKCRYSQDLLSKQVLLATQNAQLWHIVSRSDPVRFDHLERVRQELRSR